MEPKVTIPRSVYGWSKIDDFGVPPEGDGEMVTGESIPRSVYDGSKIDDFSVPQRVMVKWNQK